MKLKYCLITCMMILFIAVIQMSAGENPEPEKHPEVDFSLSCKECHSEMTPNVYQAWRNSAHGTMNYGCYMCHGDGREEFAVKPGTERCVGCHSPQAVDFSNLLVKNCFDCHPGHSLKFHQK